MSKDSFLWNIFVPLYHNKCLLNSERGPGISTFKFLNDEEITNIQYHKNIKVNCEYNYIIEGGEKWKEIVDSAIISMKEDGKQYYDEILSLYNRTNHLLIMIIDDHVYRTRVVSKELRNGDVEYIL